MRNGKIPSLGENIVQFPGRRFESAAKGWGNPPISGTKEDEICQKDYTGSERSYEETSPLKNLTRRNSSSVKEKTAFEVLFSDLADIYQAELSDRFLSV